MVVATWGLAALVVGASLEGPEAVPRYDVAEFTIRAEPAAGNPFTDSITYTTDYTPDKCPKRTCNVRANRSTDCGRRCSV